MVDDGAPLPPYLRYWSQPRPDPAAVVAAAGRAIAATLVPAELAARVRARTADGSLAAGLVANRDCIAHVVHRELDPHGDGRSGTGAEVARERLAEHFRGTLGREAVGALRPLLETLCLQGVAAGAAYDCALPGGPADLRQRGPADILPRWADRPPDGRAVPADLLGLLDAAGGVAVADLVALATLLGLVRGSRPRRDRAAVADVGNALLAAGADLYLYLTSRTDHLYA
jgi:hypothetical protein